MVFLHLKHIGGCCVIETGMFYPNQLIKISDTFSINNYINFAQNQFYQTVKLLNNKNLHLCIVDIVDSIISNIQRKVIVLLFSLLYKILIIMPQFILE